MLFTKNVGFLMFLSILFGILVTIYRTGYTEDFMLHSESFFTAELGHRKIDDLIATVAEDPIIGAEIWITVKDNNGNLIDGQRFDVKGVGFSFFEDIYSGECPSSTGPGVAGLKAIGWGEGCNNGFDECGNKCVSSGNSYKIIPCSGNQALIVGFDTEPCNSGSADAWATYNIDTKQFSNIGSNECSSISVINQAFPCTDQ